MQFGSRLLFIAPQTESLSTLFSKAVNASTFPALVPPDVGTHTVLHPVAMVLLSHLRYHLVLTVAQSEIKKKAQQH